MCMALNLSVRLGNFKAAPHQGSDPWPLISTSTTEPFINAAPTVTHTHTHTYTAGGRHTLYGDVAERTGFLWEWAISQLKQQEEKCEGRSHSRHGSNTHALLTDREGREKIHLLCSQYFCVYVCISRSVYVSVCVLTFWQIDYSTSLCVFVSVDVYCSCCEDINQFTVTLSM